MVKRQIDIERKNKWLNRIGIGLLIADAAVLVKVLLGMVLPQWAVAFSLVLNGVLFTILGFVNASMSVTEEEKIEQ